MRFGRQLLPNHGIVAVLLVALPSLMLLLGSARVIMAMVIAPTEAGPQLGFKVYLPLVTTMAGGSADRAGSQPAATFTVDTTADSGLGSFRQAILLANANVGPDTITFAIQGTGVHTITVLSPLPTITDEVFIDATTQPGVNCATGSSAATLLVVLDGISAGSFTNGLEITAGNSTVKGLVINRFGSNGIELETGGSNRIECNYIGTDAGGTADLGNSSSGVNLDNSANNTIGGTTSAARNVLSGNGDMGVWISGSSSSGNQILGNFIGTDHTGTAAVGNDDNGIHIDGANDNIIGGTEPGARNVIAGNRVGGIDINSLSTGNVVQGNLIGTDVSGTAPLGNRFDGIFLEDVTGNTIGGTEAGAGNLIGFNYSSGISIVGFGSFTTGNTIQGNFIGTDASGTLDLGNWVEGILIQDASGTRIGGTTPGAANLIAFNAEWGVFVVEQEGRAISNTIRANSIHSNGLLGINLGFDTVHANDDGDGDSGPNNYQNYPVLTEVKSSSGSTTIKGTLNSVPNTSYILDFYNNSACTSYGYGEGKTYIGGLEGSTAVTTDGTGNATFSASFPVALRPGYVVAATATDPNGNTSEFGPCSIDPSLVVTTNADSGDGSLRQAIEMANTNAGADTIAFNIPGTGVQTITLQSALPPIDAPVTINGATQPGANCATDGAPANLKIVLDGSAADSSTHGLYIFASNVTVKGLVINSFGQSGIRLEGQQTHIECNYIGTDALGSADLGNARFGIDVHGSSNTIGGSTPATRNVISGNLTGMVLGSGSHTVAGNYIGTNADGTAALPNNLDGIQINSDNNVIGGSTTASGNVISGNSQFGISIYGDNNEFFGNNIGLDATGAVPVANQRGGISISGSDNLIGGGSVSARNIISGNQFFGIQIAAINNEAGPADGNFIQGNYIGTDVSGLNLRGNSGHGIVVYASSYNTIGGSIATGNLIVGSTDTGVLIQSGSGNIIRANSIANNVGLGIDLGVNFALGVTPNDAGDADAGPNDLQNFPQLTSVTDTTIRGTLNSTANMTFTIDFYANTSFDSRGNGEGEVYLGVQNVTTDDSGNATFSFNYTPVSGKPFITATATKAGTAPDYYESTSEFSGKDQPPVNTVPGAQQTGYNAPRVFSGANANQISVADPDSAGNTIAITLSVTSGSLTLNGTSGLVFRAGDGANDATMTFTGTLEASNTALNGLTFTPESGSSGEVSFSITSDDQASPALGGPLTDSDNFTIAVDPLFAYTVTDSAQASGQQYSYIDATGGTPLNFGINEDGAAPVTLPFQFSFYDNPSNQIIISNNGGLIFNNANPQTRLNYENTELSATTSSSDSLIVPFWDDLYTFTGEGTVGRSSNVYYTTVGTAPNRQFVVEWFDIPHANAATNNATTDTATFELILYETTNNIKFQYKDVTFGRPQDLDNGRSATVGIRLDQYQVHQYSFNQPSLSAGFAICFQYPDSPICPTEELSFVVTTTADDGAGSLRQAIRNSNENAGTDTITFAIPDTGVQTITLLSALPTITDPVIIDGTSQPEATCATADVPANLLIQLDGSSAGPDADGLHIITGTTTVQGLVVNGFEQSGIRVQTGGSNIIRCNYIGTNAAGNAAAGNGTGVLIENSPGNFIGGFSPSDRNLISGNEQQGIWIRGGAATGNRVYGNYIGTDPTGDAAVANDIGVLVVHAPANEIGLSPAVRPESSSDVGVTSVGENGPSSFGNLISGNNLDGVVISGSRASGNLVRGNYIGTNLAGTASLPNRSDGVVVSGAPNSVIGGTAFNTGNLISGNYESGIELTGASDTTVQGNYIGTDYAGTRELGNLLSGVRLVQTSGNTIGGVTDGARNLISGNHQDGIYIFGEGSGGNVVEGNYIGTSVDGSSDLGNLGDGIEIVSGSENGIGRDVPGAGNLISGNQGAGVRVTGATAGWIQGNKIGTDATGAYSIGNDSYGVYLQDATNTRIGGATEGTPGNLISGNGNDGVRIESGVQITVVGNTIGTNSAGTGAIANFGSGVAASQVSNIRIGGSQFGDGNLISGNFGSGIALDFVTFSIVQGNRIGTDASGAPALSNFGVGIFITGVSNNTVGGRQPGAGNIVAGNASDGIRVGAGASSLVAGNSITANTGLGINLGFDSVTPNDLGDGDGGEGAPNNLQNFPVLTSVSGNTITGTLNSTPNMTFTIDFYANSAFDEPSGYGEGEVYLGSTEVTTEDDGNITFSYTYPPQEGSDKPYITSTATDFNGNTSEFSGENQPPVNTVPSEQATNQDTALVFPADSSKEISVADQDIGSGIVAITLTAIRGTLTLSGIDGLQFRSGDGTRDAAMTFTGNIEDSNAALNGLTFEPEPGYSGDEAKITITSDDQASAALGGPGTDTDSVNIIVVAEPTPTNTPVPLTATNTAVPPTPTNTPVPPTATDTPVPPTAIITVLPPTATATSTPTHTPTATFTPTATNTATPTNTPSPTSTPCPTGWSLQAPYPIPILDNAVVTHGNFIYSFGGVSESSVTSQAYRFDGAKWLRIASMPASREHPSVVSDGIYIYILGGADTIGTRTNSVYRYDPNTNTYTTLAPFVTPRFAHTVVYLEGKIYLFAGLRNSTSLLSEVYTISTNSWATSAAYPLRVGFVAAIANKGYIYAAGGVDSPGVATAKSYRYDPLANVWEDAPIADLPATRWGGASDLYRNQWFVAGGYVGGSSDGNISSSTLSWNASANQWVGSTAMGRARTRMSGSTLGNMFFVTGGRGNADTFTGSNDHQRFLAEGCPSFPGTSPQNSTPTTTPVSSAEATMTANAPTATPVSSAEATKTAIAAATATSIASSQPTAIMTVGPSTTAGTTPGGQYGVFLPIVQR